ncbi:hypothetical protein BM523_02395 [Alteromonas mediterranea]|uniref:hypothetical protein n=1 Tax=Alteromonas mediterranea TaxID=314275 RepID=UPI0009041B4A|nr:hypothetical protein [Alteromonas mediterranea]APD92945.1 hypothetical protein BM523_02395 [Alteromonas mediterranea]APD96559.1 hypothetical protein BM525_02380 [Alteromonas mediterranea]
MVSLFRSLVTGIVVGIAAGLIFLWGFADYISEQYEALFFAVFIGVAIIIVDMVFKKRKSKVVVDS